jgi:hypothetical protein
MAKQPRQHEQRFFHLDMVSKNEQWRSTLVDAQLECWHEDWISFTHQRIAAWHAAWWNRDKVSSSPNIRWEYNRR